ncbi:MULTISPECIES: hypothetical protein [Haloarcula]|uniref:hypothetical protein n=1 Tax=Haloarcula TaxID=2237 RepID=UPI0023E796BF|nr:hypothetical protein [Halomicroarcula sp. SHR3]
MKRRNFVLGLGGLASAGTLAMGTGAFTSVSADRRLQVETADDNDALLGLEELGEGYRSTKDGSQVKFNFPSLDNQDPDLGLGADSVYEFDRDADESDKDSPTEGLLRIENQGTQPVDTYSEHETDSELEIELYDVTDPDKTALGDDPVTLDVGEHVDVGFRIRTFDADIGTFDETLTIVAEV